MTMRRLGRPDCSNLGVVERREWLVTNGRGSYAMGTVAGTLTRSYHGLLVAALDPPVARRLLVPTVALEVQYRGTTYPLSTNRWASGGRVPEGWRYIESFAVVDGVPTWTYLLGDSELEVAIAMPDGLDRTAVALRAVRAVEPLRVVARVLVADRDHHGGRLPDPERFTIHVEGDRAAVMLPDCGRTLYVTAPGAVVSPHRDQWSAFFLARESERGLNAIDDYLYAVDARFRSRPANAAGSSSDSKLMVTPRRRSSRRPALATPRSPATRPIRCARNSRLRRTRSWWKRGRAARRERRSSPATRGFPTGAATR